MTSTIGSNAVKIFLIIVSALQAGVKDATSWSGIVLTVASIVAYGYFSFKEKEEAKAAAAAAKAEAKQPTLAEEAPSEKTPLRT